MKDKPILTVFNKIDKLPPDSGLLEQLRAIPESVCISAKQGTGLDDLMELITEHLQMKSVELELLIPYSESGKAAKLHTAGTILKEEYLAEGTKVTVRLDISEADAWQPYVVEPKA